MKTFKELFLVTLIGFFPFIFFQSCSTDENNEISEVNEEASNSESTTTENEDFSDWTEETHSKNADPNYDEVFDDASVMKIKIVIDSDKWEDMQTDLSSLLGSSSGNNQPFMPGPGMQGPGMQDQGAINTSDQNVSFDDPIWEDCSLYYDSTEWYHVGIRYKGNSSLQRAYQSGSKKLSFKLDFDEYEDDYPDLKNQRFYGFKQLNLNNNFDDESLMREKVTADLFRSFGVPASHTRFCVLYVDHGDGEEFYGVYTIVEEVDDTVIDTQFDDNDGNLYKPDGDAASFANNTYDEDEFVKKTNEDDSDFSDVLSLYNLLNNDSTFTNDKDTWCTNLEKVLNVPEFLKWLAANTIIQNWDTYGNMTHNYYLYNDPTTGLLNWIPWDNNEALNSNNNRNLSLSLSEVSEQWPLINYLMTVDNYKAEYEDNLQNFIDDVYNSSSMNTLYDTYYNLLKDYASQEGVSAFSSAVSTLRTHVSNRTTAVNSYLSE